MATITTGGTAQVALAADTNKGGYWVQNQSTGPLYISDTGTAVANDTCLQIPAGAYYETPPSYLPKGAVSIIGATTGQAYNAGRW